MSTTQQKPAPLSTKHESENGQAQWRIDAEGGSMVPRSALEVLVNLIEKVTGGKVGE